MGQKFERMIPVMVVVVCTIFPLSRAGAQAVSLQEQLVAQYKAVKMGSDTSGYSVTEEGTLLAVQKGGLLGVPYSDKTTLTNKYEGGTVHGPSGLLVSGKKALFGHFSQTQSQGQTTKLFAKGDKIYPTKIDVNLEKDTVTMGIVACDTCNKTDPPTYNKANVVFQFPKGALAKASAGDVEDTIGQLLSISDCAVSRIRAGIRADSKVRREARISRVDSSRPRNNPPHKRPQPNRRPLRRAKPPIRCKVLWASRTRSSTWAPNRSGSTRI